LQLTQKAITDLLKKFKKNTPSRYLGKTALITGASSGIGAAAAASLAAEGLNVVLVARRQEKLEQLAREISALGGQALVMPADLSTSLGVEQLVRDLFQKGIRVDVLVNNAGFGWYGYYADMAFATAHEMLQVNISAVIQLTRLLLPGMLEHRSGHIINIGSIAGSMPNQGVAIYAASKAFLNAFTTSLHRELRGSGVQVSVVRPGPVKTEFFQTARTLPEGGSVPAERFAVSAELVASAIVSLLGHPRRVVFVPWFLGISAWLEPVFGGLIDRLGPLLLRRRSKPVKNPL
jgi:short-subunit dehydrogenase